MPEQVERFSRVGERMIPDPEGDFVPYSDYEELKAERDQARKQILNEADLARAEAKHAQAQVKRLEGELEALLPFADVTAARKQALEELAEEFERLAHVKPHDDALELRSGTMLDAAIYCREQAAAGEEKP